MSKINIPPRMKELTLWALWWLVVGGATLWLLVGSVAYWVLHGWLPEKAEGWVQAFGSIAAILAAVWVARRNDRREDQAVIMENARLAWLADCGAEQMNNALEKLLGTDAAQQAFRGASSGMGGVQEAADHLRSLLSRPLPHGLVRPIFKAVSFANSFISEVEGARENRYPYRSKPTSQMVNFMRRKQEEFKAIWLEIYKEYERQAKAAALPYPQRVFQ